MKAEQIKSEQIKCAFCYPREQGTHGEIKARVGGRMVTVYSILQKTRAANSRK